jgi:DNA-binding SARP family transcriptional activator
MSDQLQINSLGGVSLKIDGQPVTGLALRKAEALLIYLAMSGRAQPREVLTDLLWDDLPQERAMANLRVVLSSLRKSVGEFVDIGLDDVRLRPDANISFDVHHLEVALDTNDSEDLRQALAHYQGEFLEGFFVRNANRFEEWAFLERERLRRIAVTGLQQIVSGHLQAGSYLQGITQATRLLQIDPLMESAHRQMIELLALSGQRAQALVHCKQTQELLRRELGIDLGPETVALEGAIRAGKYDNPPPSFEIEAAPSIENNNQFPELMNLADDLGIDLDLLPTDPMMPLVSSLMLFMWHNGRLGELLVYLRKEQSQSTRSEILLHLRPKLTTHEARVRHALIDRVRVIWIQGLLDNTLHGMMQLELGLEHRSRMVDRPWAMTVSRYEQKDRIIAADMHLIDLLREVGGAMLILGEPGAGKTTMLLQLARDLLDVVELDDNQPIPLVFNLSSWSPLFPFLLDWLVEELATVYQVNREFGRRLLQTGSFRLLLDGLDEVREVHREACVLAINAYRQAYGLTERGAGDIVVCSRLDDYKRLPTRLKFLGAVNIQPLSLTTVDDYLAGGGERVAALRTILAEDSFLQELAQNPLTLSVLLLAFEGLDSEILANKDGDWRLNQLFATYVQQMFRRRPLVRGYSQKQAEHWLACLAGQMFDQSQTVFQLERLQPNWFSLPIMKEYELLVRLLYSLVFAGAGAVCGFVLQAPEVSPFEIDPALFNLAAVVGGLLLGGVFGFLDSISDIKAVEILVWSWRKLLARNIWRRGFEILGRGLLFGGFTGLLGLAVGLAVSGARGVVLGLVGFQLGTVSGLVFWAAYDLLATGLETGEIEERIRVNQGIRRSAKIAIQFFLVFGIVLALVLGASFSAMNALPLGLELGIAAGLLGGLIMSLSYGGATVVKHYALRFVLAKHNVLPMRLTTFLDDMVSRGMLRKIGGDYVFIHRKVLDYFAQL